MDDPQYIRLLYDTKLNRPGCVLLQALAGCPSDALNRFFTSQDWLITRTPDMKVMHGTEEQWSKRATTSKAWQDAHAKPRAGVSTQGDRRRT